MKRGTFSGQSKSLNGVGGGDNNKRTFVSVSGSSTPQQEPCHKNRGADDASFYVSRALDSSEQPARASRKGRLVLVDPEKLDSKLVRSDGAKERERARDGRLLVAPTACISAPSPQGGAVCHATFFRGRGSVWAQGEVP